MLNKYIEQAKERQKVSQNGLAKLMGITSAAMSGIVNSGRISDENIVKLARLAGVKPEIILVEHELSKPLKPEVKSMWERIGGYAAVWVLVATSVIFWSALPRIVNDYSILCKIADQFWGRFQNIAKSALECCTNWAE